MEPRVSLVAGYATTGQGAGPMIVTQRAGLFAKHGLEVEVRLMGGATGVVRGLVSGEIQFGNLAAPALLRAVLAEGADLVFITGGINQQFLIGRPGLADRRQLAGGRIGSAGDGGLNDVLVEIAIGRLGREGITGIRAVPGSLSGKQRIERLLRGEIEAEVLTPPESVEALRRGCPTLVDFAEYGLNFALGGIAARRSYLEQNEEIARRFVRAYVEGLHRYRTDREFTVSVQQDYSRIPDRSVAEETYDTTCPGMPRVPYPIPSALKSALAAMARTLPAARAADPNLFVEPRFVRELDENGFIASLYESGGRR